MSSRLIILDRDGVINEDSDAYIKSPDEWVPIPGSIDAIARLSRAGFILAVATNQSGLGRGYFDAYALARMHEKMHRLVEAAGGLISGVFYCPHTPEDKCRCRKPATGLLEQIEQELGLSPDNAFYVGDSENDLACAAAKNCIPVLVLTGKGKATQAALPPDAKQRVLIFPDLAGASEYMTNNASADISS